MRQAVKLERLRRAAGRAAADAAAADAAARHHRGALPAVRPLHRRPRCRAAPRRWSGARGVARRELDGGSNAHRAAAATPPAATPPPHALRVDDMARVLSMLNSTDEMIRTHLTPRGGNTPRAAEAAAAAESLAALLVTLPSAPLDDDLADDCHVCLQPMRAGEDARALPCIHRFHRECIDRWLAVKRVCPSCKFDVSGRGAES